MSASERWHAKLAGRLTPYAAQAAMAQKVDGRTLADTLDEGEMAREALTDAAMVPCVYGSATHCGADPDRDMEDYCGGCVARWGLARLEGGG